MGTDDLVLDRQVRDWVFIPLTVSIALMKLLTQYAHQLMFSAENANAKKEPKEIRELQAVTRSQRFRANYKYIPENSFKMRKEFFAGKDVGLFLQKPVTKPPQEAMATDPSFMVDMMKKNLTGIVPQLAMGMFVNFFFSGFVMGKIPFTLSPRFRPMLQRGIDLVSLDVSYFTSLSYYILLLFGLRGVFSLVFREDTVDETEIMRKQMANPMGGGGPGFDAEGAFKQERTALGLIDWEWSMETAEENALEVLKAKFGPLKPKRS